MLSFFQTTKKCYPLLNALENVTRYPFIFFFFFLKLVSLQKFHIISFIVEIFKDEYSEYSQTTPTGLFVLWLC